MSNPDLKGTCVEAHQKFPKNCSGAVKYIAAQMGYTLPDVDANHLIDYFENSKKGWTPVDETRAQTLADTNQLVVAGKKNPSGNGHIVVVLPGGKTNSGGYQYIDKKTGNTKTTLNRGEFPRSCSTSLGSWPGAVSTGDKSVFDSWGSVEKYKGVKYWSAPSQKG